MFRSVKRAAQSCAIIASVVSGMVAPSLGHAESVPVEQLILRANDMPFERNSWRFDHYAAQQLDDYVHARLGKIKGLHFVPETCSPPTDAQSLALIDRELKISTIDILYHRQQDKGMIVLLMPDNADARGIIDRMEHRLQHCESIEVSPYHPNNKLRFNAHASVRVIAPPHVNYVQRMYAYRGAMHMHVERYRPHMDAVHREDYEGGGIGYIALVRDVWVVVLEGSVNHNTDELMATFTKQVQRVQRAG